MSISLEFQELERAAQLVAAGAPPLNDILTELGGTIETAAYQNLVERLGGGG